MPITFSGIILIARPPFLFGNENYTSESTVGLLFGLLCAFMMGLLGNAARKVGKKVHFTVSMLYYAVFGIIVLGLLILSTTGFSYPCQVRNRGFDTGLRHGLRGLPPVSCYLSTEL